VGTAAVCWALWLNRNDAVFRNIVANSNLQVIFRETLWIKQWSILSKEEEGDMLKDGCRHLEGVALQLFGSWKNRKYALSGGLSLCSMVLYICIRQPLVVRF
jgi:hypothetical protein